MKIKKIEIEGFRGFVNKQTFEFAPVTILFGVNGTGKSSTLNAVEWCLWGKKCIGRNTGIRERINWEVKNRNFDPNPKVKIEFEDGTQLEREWLSEERDKVSGNLPELLKRFSYKDFSTCVYQHQEAIRAIIVEEPKTRNEGFDRLFGLSDYRNIADSLQNIINRDVNPGELQNEISSLEIQIKGKIDAWNKIIEQNKKDLITLGLEEKLISSDGEKQYKQKIKEKLSKFIEEIKVDASEEFKGLSTEERSDRFCQIVKREVSELRGKLPEQEEQNKLFKRRSVLSRLLDEYKDKNQTYNSNKEEFEKFIRENDTKDALLERKSKIQKEIEELDLEIKNKDLQGKVVLSALEFLETEGIDKNICPVCGKTTENLLEHLKEEYEKKYKASLNELKENFKSKKKDMEELVRLINELARLEESVEEQKNSLNENIKAIEKELSREIKDDQDPKAILEKEIDEIGKNIKQLEDVIKTRQELLNNIENDIEILKKISEVIKYQNLRQEADQIRNTDEWKKMKGISDDWKRFADKLNGIISAIKKASQDEAKERISRAQEKINNYFKTITNHPSINRIKIEVEEDPRTGGNNYEIKDENGIDVIPILSQGHMNALALSIFLALCENLHFGFIMLDDSSQSLSKGEKERLIDVLEEVSKVKNIILSTMDPELYELARNLTKQKIIYIFERWDSKTGPSVKIER